MGLIYLKQLGCTLITLREKVSSWPIFSLKVKTRLGSSNLLNPTYLMNRFPYGRILRKNILKEKLTGVLQVFGDQLYLLPELLPDLGKLKIARNGLHLGTFKKKRFEPSFALGLALKPSQVKQSVEIDQEAFVKYVAGETVQLAESLPNGWYQVLVQGNGLGFAKVTGNVLKNYFPKGLRFK